MACLARPRPLPVALAGFFTLIALGALVGACARTEPAAPGPTPTVQPVSVPPDIEKLRGLSAADLVTLLGTPDFVRHDPPAEVWQYRGTDCVLDLFLYKSAGAFHVAYAEMRDRGLIRVSQSDCYADLIAGRARPL